MPSPLEPKTATETSELRWCLATIAVRAPEAAKAWSYYQGTQQEQFAFLNRKVNAVLAKSSRSMRVNMARTPVSAVVDRLTVEQFTTPGNDDAQATLDDLVEDQDMIGLAHEAHERAEGMGEAFILAWPDGLVEVTEDDPDGTRRVIGEETERMVLQLEDPTTTCVKYDDEHRSEIELAGRMWLRTDKRHRVNVYYTNHVQRFLETAEGSDMYDLLPDNDELPGVWEYPESMQGRVPAFHYRTNRTPHGRPGHADAIPVQAIIDNLVATDASMVQFAGFPIRWAIHKGDPTASAAYDSANLDDEDASDVESETGRTGTFTASPAAFWDMDADQVGEFSPADPKVMLARLEFYLRALLSVSDTPLSEWEGLAAGISGESRKQEEKGLLRKVGRRQSLYGRTHSELLSYTLEAGGTADVVVVVQWADPSQVDEGQAWTVTAQKISTGLPLHQALTEHGYTAADLEAFGITTDTVLTPAEMGQLVQRMSTAVLAFGPDTVGAWLKPYGLKLGAAGDDPELPVAGATG